MKRLACVLLICVVSSMASANLYKFTGGGDGVGTFEDSANWEYVNDYPSGTTKNYLTPGRYVSGDTTVTLTGDTRDGIFSEGTWILQEVHLGRDAWGEASTDTDTLNLNSGSLLYLMEAYGGQLLMGASGVLNINDGSRAYMYFMHLGNADNGATVNINSGLMHVDTDTWCVNNGSTVTINDGGTFKVKALSKYADGYDGGNVDIHQGGTFVVYGNEYDALVTLAQNDFFTTYGTTDDTNLNIYYSTADDKTYVTSAIPEPATLVLLGLGGMLSLGRRRR